MDTQMGILEASIAIRSALAIDAESHREAV